MEFNEIAFCSEKVTVIVNIGYYCVTGYSRGQEKEGYRGHSSSQGRTPRVYGTVTQCSLQTAGTKREQRF